MLTDLLSFEDHYTRLSEHDLGVALGLLDTHTTAAVARQLGCDTQTLRRNLAAIGWTR